MADETTKKRSDEIKEEFDKVNTQLQIMSTRLIELRGAYQEALKNEKTNEPDLQK